MTLDEITSAIPLPSKETTATTMKWLDKFRSLNPCIYDRYDGTTRLEWKSNDGMKFVWLDIKDETAKLFADTGFYATIDPVDMVQFRVYGMPIIKSIMSEDITKP